MNKIIAWRIVLLESFCNFGKFFMLKSNIKRSVLAKSDLFCKYKKANSYITNKIYKNGLKEGCVE